VHDDGLSNIAKLVKVGWSAAVEGRFDQAIASPLADAIAGDARKRASMEWRIDASRRFAHRHT
jgi:hypothetical protein